MGIAAVPGPLLGNLVQAGRPVLCPGQGPHLVAVSLGRAQHWAHRGKRKCRSFGHSGRHHRRGPTPEPPPEQVVPVCEEAGWAWRCPEEEECQGGSPPPQTCSCRPEADAPSCQVPGWPASLPPASSPATCQAFSAGSGGSRKRGDLGAEPWVWVHRILQAAPGVSKGSRAMRLAASASAYSLWVFDKWSP